MNLDNSSRKLYNVGLSYKKADINTRSKFSISKKNQLLLLEEAKELGLQGVFVLSTCNRTEVMGFASHPFELISLLCKYSGESVEDFVKVANIFKGDEAIDHLFRTATGLESQILGDYEIVAQLKKAFQQAKVAGNVNAYLERLFNLVLQASKQVKNQTQFSSGITSVAYVAIQYALNHTSNFNDKNILVLGLGDIGKNTCKNLIQYTNNNNIKLINRTQDKADKFGNHKERVTVVPFENLPNELHQTDVLIVSTSASQPIVTKEFLPNDRPILIVDLSVPKNVDSNVEELSNVTLVNVDILSKETDKTLALREKEVFKVEEILEKHKSEFSDWLSHRKHVPALTAIKETLVSIKAEGIDYHSRKIENFDANQAEIISSHIIQKITTQFAKHLKDSNTNTNQTLDVLHKVFNIDTTVNE
ncbi:glutamyl-tRNA reductase [Urechidicola croceus]|uniref:Glutamyl-tRNA reductase n=1 Tax=Urechidicola croceus TaxID=1850246 RepID=A0A1D8P6R4_9FLAO|nr:glutamyl-tRNA reductase [Urechidicola croceus]AOW20264.1 glutamyl-tRNA reductase [Urechidicola croceus]